MKITKEINERAREIRVARAKEFKCDVRDVSWTACVGVAMSEAKRGYKTTSSTTSEYKGHTLEVNNDEQTMRLTNEDKGIDYNYQTPHSMCQEYCFNGILNDIDIRERQDNPPPTYDSPDSLGSSLGSFSELTCDDMDNYSFASEKFTTKKDIEEQVEDIVTVVNEGKVLDFYRFQFILSKSEAIRVLTENYVTALEKVSSFSKVRTFFNIDNGKFMQSKNLTCVHVKETLEETLEEVDNFFVNVRLWQSLNCGDDFYNDNLIYVIYVPENESQKLQFRAGRINDKDKQFDRDVALTLDKLSYFEFAELREFSEVRYI